mgnify:CR=1 FL=1
MKMKVVGKEFDLATVVPVTIGDLKKLKRTYNLSEKELAAGDVTASAALLLVLLQKFLEYICKLFVVLDISGQLLRAQ